MFYLAKVDGEEATVLASQPGRRLPAQCTGLGKAMLAFMDEEQLGALPPDELVG